MTEPGQVRPLLLSHSDGGGGAGRAAHRLHRALRGNGLASRMLVDFVDTDDPDVQRPRQAAADLRRRLRIGADQLPAVLAGLTEPQSFSPGIASAVSARSIDAMGADIVNVHWTNFGFLSITDLGRIRTPIVWTLHDMWAFTGGRMYDDESPQARWRSDYDSPAVRAPGQCWDLEAWVWRRKRAQWRTAQQLVTPSRWLARIASQSALLHDWPVTVIPNALDTEVFAPRSGARQRLGLPEGCPIVLLALASDTTDARKGTDLLLAAMSRLATERPDVELVVVGHAAPPAGWPTKIRTRWLGRISDDSRLADTYRSADVAVVPSRQDNLPQTGTEAAACGTAVVAFDIGGMPDIVEHERSGYLARPFDTDDLAHGIGWVLGEPDRAAALGRAARAHAEQRWAQDVVADEYAQLFASVKDAHPPL
jgi:glycosyltransferase involved in cell wall biosynthesis